MWTVEPGDWRQALQQYSPRAGEWLTCEQGSEAWHQARQTYVTATQIRDALGLGYAGSSLASVHAYRRGELLPVPDTWLLACGRAVEPALLAWWGRQHGVEVEPGGVCVADGVLASLDGHVGGVPVEAKYRQPWGPDPYADGGATPGEVCQLQVQCWVTGAPAGILVVARGAEVHTRWVRHPEGEALEQLEAAVAAIRRADEEGWPAVADWLLQMDQWATYREQGRPVEPRRAPELAPVVEELLECERLLTSARSEVRVLERRREAAYCRLSRGGEGEIDTGRHHVAPVYRCGRLAKWKVTEWNY